MRTMSADTLDPEVPVAETRFDISAFVLRGAIYIGAWLLVVYLFALVGFLSDWFLYGPVYEWADYLRWTSIQWGTLAVLLPATLWLMPDEAIEPPHRWRLLWANFGVSLVFALSAVTLGAVLTHFIVPGRPEVRYQLSQFLTKHAATDFLAYWVLVGVRQALRFYRERIRREIQASRLQAQLAQSRLLVLKMQLHPHFLFNTLHAAATLTREDATAAEDMLLRLAELLRTYLDDDRQEITLSEELELLDLYLGIQRVRFRDRLTSRVNVDPELLQCAVPSLVLQPIVENAIAHGIGKNVGEDCVEVDCYRVARSLCIDVRNRNSVLDAAPDDLFRRGIGLSNSRLRLKELYANEGHIELDALKPRGAICRIRMPMKQLEHRAAKPGAKAA